MKKLSLKPDLDFRAHPIPVTILAIIVLCITFWNALRIYSAIANWQVLREFGANPAYILGTGLFWMVAGFIVYEAFWEGRRYAFRAGWGAAGLYLVWYWLDRLVIQPAPATNAPFSAIVSAVTFAIFAGIMLLPSTRAFFNSPQSRRQDEQETEDSAVT